MSSPNDTHVNIAIQMARQDAKLFSIACRSTQINLPAYALARTLAAANLLNYKGGEATLRDAAKIEAAFPQDWSWAPAAKDEEE